MQPLAAWVNKSIHQQQQNSIFLYLYLYTLLSQWEFLPWEIWVFPQGKPAVTELRYPTLINYKVHAGSFPVSVIHRPLTWTTGSLMCVRDNSYTCVRIHTEVRHTDSESAQHF